MEITMAELASSLLVAAVAAWLVASSPVPEAASRLCTYLEYAMILAALGSFLTQSFSRENPDKP